MKNYFRNRYRPDPISTREPAAKFYVDGLKNDSSITRNNMHVDFRD